MPTCFLPYALELARAGIRVHPLRRRDKIPVEAGWPQVATTDENQITTWWTRDPQSNIGIVPGRRSGVVVLDIDPRNDGENGLRLFEQRFGKLPPTKSVRTGSGGWHYYFKHPDGDPLKKHAQIEGCPGVELYAGDNSNIVAPPSIHPSGGVYEWVGNPDSFAELPAEFLAFLKANKPPRSEKPATNFSGPKGPSESPEALAAMLSRCGVSILKRKDLHGGGVGFLIECPMGLGHDSNGSDTMAIWRPDGLGFKCMHARCADVGWKRFREQVDKTYDPNEPHGDIELVSIDHEAGEPVTSTNTLAVTSDDSETVCIPPKLWREFPIEHIPTAVRRFSLECAKAIGCNVAFIIMPLLAALASAIGNTRRIYLKRRWSEPAILWVVPIAESGWKKSPPMEMALRPVRELNRRAMRDYAEKMREYETAKLEHEKSLTAWKRDKRAQGGPPESPEKPKATRVIVDDTTIEALAVILSENWRGTLLARDELSGWFGSFDRYVSARGGDAPKWIEFHGGRPSTIDRKTSGHTYIDRANVSITGTIQPGVLARALTAALHENGLAARFLFAMPPRTIQRWTEDDVSEAAENAMADVFDALYGLAPVSDDRGEHVPGLLYLTPAAKQIWIQFYNEHGSEQLQLQGDLAAAWSKLEGGAARLALVVQLVRWASGEPGVVENVVDESSMLAGIALSRWFGYEADRVYAALAESAEAREQRELMTWLRGRGRGDGVTARELSKAMRRFRGDAKAAKAALDGLVSAGFGKWVSSTAGQGTLRFQPVPMSPVPTNPVGAIENEGNGDWGRGDTPTAQDEGGAAYDPETDGIDPDTAAAAKVLE